ncbi:protein of unknown function [Burkholderia multivorans]
MRPVTRRTRRGPPNTASPSESPSSPPLPLPETILVARQFDAPREKTLTHQCMTDGAHESTAPPSKQVDGYQKNGGTPSRIPLTIRNKYETFATAVLNLRGSVSPRSHR